VSLNVTFQFDMSSDDLVILETCYSSAATDAPITEVLSQQFTTGKDQQRRDGQVLLLLVVMKIGDCFAMTKEGG
jgi:hypothetical protein